MLTILNLAQQPMIVCKNLLSSSVHPGKNGMDHSFFLLSGTNKFDQIFICDSFL
jgi:hypothetical protein